MLVEDLDDVPVAQMQVDQMEDELFKDLAETFMDDPEEDQTKDVNHNDTVQAGKADGAEDTVIYSSF